MPVRPTAQDLHRLLAYPACAEHRRQHVCASRLGPCYRVVAVDSSGNQSALGQRQRCPQRHDRPGRGVRQEPAGEAGQVSVT